MSDSEEWTRMQALYKPAAIEKSENHKGETEPLYLQSCTP